MTGYKMREFDMIFQGDAAFVAFVADVEAKTPAGPFQRTLRITDFYTKQNGGWIQTGSDTDLHPESMAAQQQTSRDALRGSKRSGCWRRGKRYGARTSRATAPRSKSCCPRN